MLPFSPSPTLPIAALLLVSALVLGCASEARRPSSTDEAAPVVRTATATARTTALPIRTSGQVGSSAEIQLAFKVGGVVEAVRADEGDRVQAGQTLARLDLSEIDAQVQEAESALAKAKRDLERTRQLYRDSVATLEEMQNAETAVETAKARAERARFNRQHAVIEAPQSGRILQRHAEAGEQVETGQPILTLGATEGGWVAQVGLPAADVVRVALGDSADVVFDAHPDATVNARVTEIADDANPRTGTYPVELSIPDADVSLKSGFIGEVTLHPSNAQDYVEVPARALTSGNGTEGTVFTVDPATQTAQRQSVEVARVLDSTIVLDGGVSAGATVVTAGGQELSDGDKVRRVESGKVEGGKVEDGKVESER